MCLGNRNFVDIVGIMFVGLMLFWWFDVVCDGFGDFFVCVVVCSGGVGLVCWLVVVCCVGLVC